MAIKKITTDLADPVEKAHMDAPDTMATKSNEVNPTIQANLNADSPAVPGNYHEFKGSEANMYDTYTNRIGKIASALGNKSPAVG